MIALRLAPLLLAFALLIAHFYRAGAFGLLVLCVAMVALVFVRRPWAARILQAGLAAGTLEWLRTLAAQVAQRHALGLPYTRLAVILGLVALLTALCALIFRTRAVRAHFGLPIGPATL